MKQTLTFLIFLMVIQAAQAQQPTSSIQEKMKADAAQMGNAYFTKDYKQFVAFMYPGVVTKSGGAANLIKQIQQVDDYMKANKLSLVKISLDTPLKVVTVGKELQSSIVQHTTVQTPNGLMTTATTMLAFSEDHGKTWKFFDAGKKDRNTLKMVAPNLSPEVLIPSSAPVSVVK